MEQAVPITREFFRVASVRSAAWTFIAGLVVVVAALTTLELRAARFFLDDDNLSQFGPVIIRACEHFWSTGKLPTWNPYQLMGAPTFAVGTYALAYPVTYLSYGLARLFGDPTATIDVFCWLHVLGGYVAFRGLARAAEVNPLLASAAAVSWALGAIPLLTAWYYMAPFATYAPLTLWLLMKVRATPAWILTCAATWGLFGLTGNVQMVAYAGVMWCAATGLMLASRNISSKQGLAAASAILIGAVFTLPAVLPSAILLKDIYRQGGEGFVLRASNLPNLLLPYPLAPTPRMLLRSSPLEQPDWFAINSLFVAVGAWAALASTARALAGKTPLDAPNTRPGHLAWTTIGWVAVVFSLGHAAGLWTLLARLPAFDKFQHASKFLYPAMLYLTLGGVMAVQKFCPPKLIAAPAAYAVAVAFAIGAFATSPVISYLDHGYPPLPAKAEELMKSGRVLAIAPGRSHLVGYALSQTQGFSTAYGVMNVSGYDPLVWTMPEHRIFLRKVYDSPVAGLRAAGVRWIVVHRAVDKPEVPLSYYYLYPPNLFATRFLPVVRGLPLAYADGDVSIYRLDDAAPLAFAGARALPVSMDESGIVVDVSGEAGAVTVNTLRIKALKARIDGRLVPAREDAWGRTVVDVPLGARRLELGV